MHKSGVVIESSEFATRRTQETKQDPTCAYIACAWMHRSNVGYRNHVKHKSESRKQDEGDGLMPRMHGCIRAAWLAKLPKTYRATKANNQRNPKNAYHEHSRFQPKPLDIRNKHPLPRNKAPIQVIQAQNLPPHQPNPNIPQQEYKSKVAKPIHLWI